MADTSTHTGSETRSTGGLLMEAVNHMSALFRKEVALAKAEVAEGAEGMKAGIGALIGAVVLALTALNVLAAALVAAITELGIDAGWSALIVGVVLAVIAAIMARAGAEKLKPGNLVPSRTAANVKRDAREVRESL